MVKTLLRDITDATKLLSVLTYGVCSEAIESYCILIIHNNIRIKSGGYFYKVIKASRVGHVL